MSKLVLDFACSIADLDSAIQISSRGGARVKIDIPDSEMPAIVRMVLFRGKRLRMHLEEETDDGTTEDRDRYFTS